MFVGHNKRNMFVGVEINGYRLGWYIYLNINIIRKKLIIAILIF